MIAQPTELVYAPQGNVRKLFRWLDGTATPPREVLVEGPAGTGKTRAWGEWLYEACGKWAHMKALVVRKYRADLHKGFQRTFEDLVLWPGHPLLSRTGGGKGENRSFYQWDNGSILQLGHMEDPQRWYSSEWDFILWNEGIESREDQWIRLGRALRKGTRPTECPFRLLGSDTNPGPPRHYLNVRCKDGRTLRITTRHKDNPSLEPDYLERLAAMTGVHRRRLYLGEWCAAEGQIWDTFDSDRHIVAQEDVPDIKWYAAGMDFGYRSPGCLLIVGFTEEQQAYVVAELYRRGWDLDRWADEIELLHTAFPMVTVVADSAEPRSIELLNKRLGHLCARKGDVFVRPVAKTKVGGKSWGRGSRDHVRTLFASDRIRIVDDPQRVLYGPDPELQGVSRSLTDEISEWAFKAPREGLILNVAQEEEPDPTCADHACDALIYVLSWAWLRDLEIEPPPTEYRPGTWGALYDWDEMMKEHEEPEPGRYYTKRRI